MKCQFAGDLKLVYINNRINCWELQRIRFPHRAVKSKSSGKLLNVIPLQTPTCELAFAVDHGQKSDKAGRDRKRG